MDRRARLRGLQAEVLLGLGLVMAMATAVLMATGLRLQEAQLAQLRGLAVQRLVTEVRASGGLAAGPSGSRWWRVTEKGAAQAWGTVGEIDAETRELAEASRREGQAMFQSGAPWQPLRFAVPLGNGGVMAMRLAPVAAGPLLLGLLICLVAVFTAFGATLLRGRVVAPLERLAEGVHRASEGDLELQLPEEGVRETAAVARAFNALASALEMRTRALEKAVADLRQSNASLRAARDGLDRAERLAAVGHLASGVAHEVGNPVGALLALLDLLGREPGLSEEGRARVGTARQQGERVRAILRELLDFSRPARGEPCAVDLQALADATLDLVRPQRRYAGVEFSLEADPATPPAWADPAAVSQALLNLVLNAADAVLERDGGNVRISLAPTALHFRAGEAPSQAPERRSPDGVELSVEDDGPGVAPEQRERIFDPFFTTKDPGLGTGLGLSNALRVAEQQGGRLDLEAPLRGRGARFVLRLPAVGERKDAGAARAARPDGAGRLG